MNLQREGSIYSLNNNIENSFGITIQELPFVSKFNLRMNPENNEHMKNCEKTLNIKLPIKPNTYTKNDNLKLIWLGPDEWLITSNNNNNLFNNLEDIIDHSEVSVTDISENRTIIRITGQKIYTLLSKFLVLDLEKNLSHEFTCAQTLFIKVPIILVRNHKEKKEPEIDIFVNRSHANYIYNLILDGTQNLDF